MAKCMINFNTNESMWNCGNPDEMLEHFKVSNVQTLHANIFTHQLLNFILKHGVNTDDEGSGRAQHLKQPWRQDWDVWVTKHIKRNGQWMHRYKNTCLDKKQHSFVSSWMTSIQFHFIWIWITECFEPKNTVKVQAMIAIRLVMESLQLIYTFVEQ